MFHASLLYVPWWYRLYVPTYEPRIGTYNTITLFYTRNYYAHMTYYMTYSAIRFLIPCLFYFFFFLLLASRFLPPKRSDGPAAASTGFTPSATASAGNHPREPRRASSFSLPRGANYLPNFPLWTGKPPHSSQPPDSDPTQTIPSLDSRPEPNTPKN